MNTHRKALLIASACSFAAGVSTLAGVVVSARRHAHNIKVSEPAMPAPAPSPSATHLGPGANGLPGRLAGLIAIPTVVRDLPVTGTGPFCAAQRYLGQQYPRVHAYLERTVVDDIGLEFFWPSAATLQRRAERAAAADAHVAADDGVTDPTADAADAIPAHEFSDTMPPEEPIVLMMHLDVMSADPAGWRYPPFSGAIANGKVYGRGSIASKGPLICLFDAIEQLLSEGWAPQRDVFILISGDTEGDAKTSRALVTSLRERNIRPKVVLDLGGAITPFPTPRNFDRYVAGIGVAQKGNATYQLSARAVGGATAAPPDVTNHAIAVLTRQIKRAISAARFTSADENIRTAYRIMWRHTQGVSKAVLTIVNVMPHLASRLFAALSRDTAPLFGTSLVTTNLQSGHGEQVVPTHAIATLQAHLALDDSIQELTRRLRRAVNDSRIRLDILEQREGITFGSDAAAYNSIARTVVDVFDDVLPVPFTTYYFTDSRFFADAADNIYCFAPLMISSEQRCAVHATNESIDIAALHQAVKFYRTWLQSVASNPPSAGAL